MNDLVQVRPRARQDIMEHAEYLAQDSMDASDRFLSAVQAAFHRFAALPGIGQVRLFSSPWLAGLRSWPVPGFPRHLIFYIAAEDRIEVVRVLHGSRDLEAALQDLPPN